MLDPTRIRESSWRAFDGWAPPPSEQGRAITTWNPFDLWRPAINKAVSGIQADFRRLVVEWREALRDLGGLDPSDNRWCEFAPLRLSREEDWSDWLAHLLGSSRTGMLARALFRRSDCSDAGSAFPTISPPVRREFRTSKGRRLDLVMAWSDGARTSVEVKLWDESYAKTFEAAGDIEADEPPAMWTHWILLPAQIEAAWDACAAKDRPPQAPEVHTLRWEDVARQLRRAVRQATEPVLWRALAFTFCAAVEQTILGLPTTAEMETAAGLVSRLDRAQVRVAIMKEARAWTSP